jgi:hypothetical protein
MFTFQRTAISTGLLALLGSVTVYLYLPEGDIRDCISIGKLVRKSDGPEEIAEIISTITKYGDQQQDK